MIAMSPTVHPWLSEFDMGWPRARPGRKSFDYQVWRYYADELTEYAQELARHVYINDQDGSLWVLEQTSPIKSQTRGLVAMWVKMVMV